MGGRTYDRARCYRCFGAESGTEASVADGSSLLTSTFIHSPGIGPGTEQRIWLRGITTWEDLLARHNEVKLPAGRRQILLDTVEESLARLAARDHLYFASALPHREHWRAIPEFGDRIAYLDIETTGMGEEHQITLIGLYDGKGYRKYQWGENLQDFPDDIGQYTTLVTFFGSGFDLPVIRRWFPRLRLNQLHIDLCFALKRVGYKGGLKSVEQQLGISRSSETTGLSGWDAVRLWNEYQQGSLEALDLLIAYNREDVVNLARLLPIACDALRERIFPSQAS